MTRVERQLELPSHSSRIIIGDGILDRIGEFCAEAGGANRCLVVSDETVAPLYAETVRSTLAHAGWSAELAVVPPGDGSKSLENAARLFDRLSACNIGRDGFVIAVGGGMVCDLAGFVAGTWMRGIASVLCPTTLEADVDASVGGKTAVNHAGGKNMVGVFHHPKVVLIDTQCLQSLGRRDLVAGMAESIKHAVLSGEADVSWHEANAEPVLAGEASTLAALIDRNVTIKASHVVGDDRDTRGKRAMLNFGHTIGHAIETASEYELRHGECVALGMVVASRASASLGLIGADLHERIKTLVERYELPARLDRTIDVNRLLALAAHDKKNLRGQLTFVLLEGLGKPVLRREVDERAVRNALDEIL